MQQPEMMTSSGHQHEELDSHLRYDGKAPTIDTPLELWQTGGRVAFSGVRPPAQLSDWRRKWRVRNSLQALPAGSTCHMPPARPAITAPNRAVV